jgi:hypothetical protein
MPIKGLTDRGLSFPEIGQIRKGAPKTDKGYVGKDLQYFRVEFDENEREAEQVFLKVYGTQPTEIRIILPFNEIERQWEAWLEAYTAGRMVARADGEKFIYLVDTKTGEMKVKDGTPHTPYIEGRAVGNDYQNKPVFCKPSGRLKVMIPELARAAYMTVLTTSVHDIANISSQLSGFFTINGGQIAGIPLMLRRRPKEISRPDPDNKSRRVRSTKWLLSIEADPVWVKAKLVELKRLALPGNGFPLLPETTSDKIIEGEFSGEFAGDYDEDDDEYQPELTTVSDNTPEVPPEPVPAKVKADPAHISSSLAKSKMDALLDEIVGLGLSENVFAAQKALEHRVPLVGTRTEKLEWMRTYRGWRDTGLEINEAAEKANAGELPT